MISVLGSGITYVQASAYNPQAVYADVLYGSYSDRSKSLKAGDEVAHRVMILLTEVTSKETSRLAKSVRIEGRILHLELPEGGEAQVAIL